jgi:FixJ family two-component response regulator
MVPIVLSAHDDRDTAIEALRAGAYDFLSKPCTTAELREAVRVALDARSRHKRRQRMLTLLKHDGQATVEAVRRVVVEAEPNR